MADLGAAVQSLVAESPGLTVHDIRARLAQNGVPGLTRREVNSYLYGHRSLFRREGPPGSLPRWYPANGNKAPASTPAVQPTPASASLRGVEDALGLYPWQRRALSAWQRAGYRGVIEAVTGAGKTRVAMAAIAAQLAAHGRVAVLVHTHELVAQWQKEMARTIPPVIGRRPYIAHLGGGSRQSLAHGEILIATAQSAAGWRMAVRDVSGLLVADEVHHYGADAWARGLEEEFDKRLGLTATYEREDLGVEENLDPYFGGVCYSVDYREALKDKVIAPFKVAFIGARFNASEAAAYEDLSDKLRRRRTKLLGMFDIPEEPFGEFIKIVGKISHGSTEGARMAGLYLSAFNKRRALLSGASSKLDRLRDLLPAVHAAERTIVFSQTQAAAELAVQRLADGRLSGAVLHSGMDLDERRDVFSAFEDGRHDLVAAPRLLDEGVDVPAADLAIVLAASRSKRQMIQRMGRVVRPKKDGRLARLAIFYIEGTSEDPDEGAHEDFTEVVSKAAADVEVFPSAAPAARINGYLNEMRP